MFDHNCSVFTIAGGLPIYFAMAVNLARSFELHNSSGDTVFHIITDLENTLPKDLCNTKVVRMPRGSLARGFSSKLHLDEFAPTPRALFLDADCLVLASLEPVFLVFKDHPVGIFGELMYDGEWFGNVISIRAKLGLSHLNKFNGGVYYVTKTAQAHSIFSFARKLEPQYDEIGFMRLRGQVDEELLIGASLALHGVLPVHNDGRFYADFQWWPNLQRLNVLKGRCTMTNPPAPHPKHQALFPAAEAHPAIVHFLGHHVESPEYRQAQVSLQYRSTPFGNVLGLVGSAPAYLNRAIRNVCRPAFHKLFGVRRVKRTDSRLIIDG